MLHDVLPLVRGTLGVDGWTLGGGTGIAMRLDHRVSYDLDFFIDSSRALRAMTPNRNPAVKAFLADRKYQYPGHYLKLELENGEIDFIVAAPVVDDDPEPFTVDGAVIPLDSLAETAAKKAFFRASDFRARDVFDFAAMETLGGLDLEGQVLRHLPAERVERLAHRLGLLLPRYEDLALAEVNPTERGMPFLGRRAAERVLAIVRAARDFP